MVEEEIDLRHYIETLWKWKVVIVLLTGIAVITSGVFSFFVLSPVYETKVTLLVSNATSNQQSVLPQGDDSIVDTVSRIPTMTLNTYMSQLTSPYFLKTVADKLGLTGETAVALPSMVSTQILKDTNLIEIRVQNTDKALATQIANTMASEFVQFVSEANQERMTKSLEFLTAQKALLKAELEQVYEELGEIQSGPDNLASLTRDIASESQALSTFRADLARAQVRESQLRASLAQIDTGLTETAPQGEEEPSPAHLELLAARSQKSLELVECTAEIAGLQQQIGKLAASVSEKESRLNSARNRENEVMANLTRIESTLSLLDTKMIEAQMAQSLNYGENTISVVSPALEPVSPVKPRKVLNMAVAGVLGGLMSVLLVFVLEYMDNTIKTQEDVMKHLNLGTLGAIPVFDRTKKG